MNHFLKHHYGAADGPLGFPLTDRQAFALEAILKALPKDGDLRGIKAKTQYPARPDDWGQGKEWPADIAFSLVHADLLRGKSIGFLPTRVHMPDDKEVEKHNWKGVACVIDEWILLEYACV